MEITANFLLLCQSLMEELLASHSTDLQQRAYELQAVIGLDAHAVECIMPSDASCEDIEVDKGLSFLNGYIQKSIEKGTQPYIPESERNINNFRNQDHHEASSHSLRFEAYELPKPTMQSRIPLATLASTELVPVPEPMYPRESYQTPLPSISSDAGSSELKLRLDGVQKKWGRPTYSPATSTSNSTSQKTVNGITQVDGASIVNSRTRETYDSWKPQVEISPEKQKLAASLFGGSSKTDKRPATGHKISKASNLIVDKSHMPKSSMEVASEKTAPVQQPPDLLDLGEPTVTNTAPLVDPFKQLEGLLDPIQVASAVNHGKTAATESPDIMTLYAETPAGIHDKDDGDLLSSLSNPPITNMPGGTTTRQPMQISKGPNLKDSLEKDALVRQMGVTPSSQNPNLFKDLIG